MIRINLLPVRQAKKREYGRQQLVFFLWLAVLEVVLLYMIHNDKKEELDSLNADIAEIEEAVSQIDEIEAQIAAIDGELNQLRQIGRVLDHLRRNRIGPGAVLGDLKYILNHYTDFPESERAERQRLQGLRGFDTNVDPNGIWLNSLSISPSRFDMAGFAVDHTAVAELLLRLETDPREVDEEGTINALPRFFVSPDLTRYDRVRDPFYGNIRAFSISGGIRYRPMRD